MNETIQKTLDFKPALERPDLVGPTVTHLLYHWHGTTSAEEILVAEIDPLFAGGIDFCTHYQIPITQGANCVIVEATRGDKRTFACCLALVNSRMDFNGIIRKTLNARRVSLAPLDEIIRETQMEYGSITPFGLPPTWPILIDEKVIKSSQIVIGSGLLGSKLSLPSQALFELPLVQIVPNLATQL